MKVEVTPKDTEFRPVTITITIESEEDLQEFFERMSAGGYMLTSHHCWHIREVLRKLMAEQGAFS